MKIPFPLTVILALFLLSGCQASNQDIPANAPSPLPPLENSATQSPTMIFETTDPAAQELIQLARAQLSKKLGISADSIFVFSVEAGEWPDASLGCPQAGISYAQVIVPGYRITLEAGGQVYTFHTDEKDQVILCTARGPDEIYLPP